MESVLWVFIIIFAIITGICFVQSLCKPDGDQAMPMESLGICIFGFITIVLSVLLAAVHWL